jgi:hypothetical protein
MSMKRNYDFMILNAVLMLFNSRTAGPVISYGFLSVSASRCTTVPRGYSSLGCRILTNFCTSLPRFPFSEVLLSSNTEEAQARLWRFAGCRAATGVLQDLKDPLEGWGWRTSLNK